MKILLTGGGTGGHITPLLAVAHELKKKQPDCHIVYIGERKGKYIKMLDGNKDIDEMHSVFAGKFRRYHGESLLSRLLDVKTNLLNIRDFFYALIGIIQAIFLVRKLNPSIIFLKGGFVGVPVGLAGAFWHKSMVTHDSDALPGLANRIVSRWVDIHAVAMDPEAYDYPSESVKQVGVLVGPDYKYIDKSTKQEYRTKLGIDLNARVLFVTGGSNGAEVINKEISRLASEYLEKYQNLYIIHQTGKGKTGVYSKFNNDRLEVHELLSNLHIYSGSADLIVTRAGANTLAEFGVQGKACIVVPNPLLTGGHQLLNARHLVDQDAIVVADERQFKNSGDSKLWEEIEKLLFKNSKKLIKLGRKLHSITKADAASELAELLITINKNEVQ